MQYKLPSTIAAVAMAALLSACGGSGDTDFENDLRQGRMGGKQEAHD